jgi:hypothetical protein
MATDPSAPVPCFECGGLSRPRRWHDDGVEHECTQCGRRFTRKEGVEGYFSFFPADLDAAFHNGTGKPLFGGTADDIRVPGHTYLQGEEQWGIAIGTRWFLTSALIHQELPSGRTGKNYLKAPWEPERSLWHRFPN